MTGDLIMEEEQVKAAEGENEIESASATSLGKFKSAEALLTAYNNLEREFTKRSQRLAELVEQAKASTSDTALNDAAAEIEAARREKKTEAAACDEAGGEEREAEVMKTESGATAGAEETESGETAGKEYAAAAQSAVQTEANEAAEAGESEAEKPETCAYERGDWKSQVEKFLSEHPEAAALKGEIGREILENAELYKTAAEPLKSAYLNLLIKNYKAPESLASDNEFLRKYILNKPEVKEKIISDFLLSLEKGMPPVIIKSGGQQPLSLPKKPKTLAEAGWYFKKGLEN
jgi:hypothetical protein